MDIINSFQLYFFTIRIRQFVTAQYFGCSAFSTHEYNAFMYKCKFKTYF